MNYFVRDREHDVLPHGLEDVALADGEVETLSERLSWLDMSKWDHEPTPERKWAIRDRTPLRQAGLFGGEGGTGKSIIELMRRSSHNRSAAVRD